MSVRTDVVQEFYVKALNTIECAPTDEAFDDARLMHCVVHGFDEPTKTIDRVVVVEGSIQVLSGIPKGRIYIKTSPWIGMRAHITVKTHLPSQGNKIHVSIV